MRRWALGFVLLCLTAVGEGAEIQYRLDSGIVTAVADAEIGMVPGYGIVILPEPEASIQWPVPAGCPSGQWGWTRIVDPLVVTAAGAGMELRPEYVGFFFSSISPAASGCYVVLNWPELTELYRGLLVDYVQALTQLQTDRDAFRAAKGW